MGIKQYTGAFFDGNKFSATSDCISVEVPLRISVNGVPFTVTMQTPGNEHDLLRGLLFTENIFRDLDFNPFIEETSKNSEGFIDALNIQIPKDLILKDFKGDRNVISSSSCGVCGKDELADTTNVHIKNTEKLNGNLIPSLFQRLNDQQINFKKSGGTHAAGAFTIDGDLLILQEDIGRHNAVDKVIGYLINNNILHLAKCINVSGRISYEIVEKLKAANIPFLASVSAPSSLAIDNAQESGITLLSFCRNEKYTVYSNPQQIYIDNERNKANT